VVQVRGQRAHQGQPPAVCRMRELKPPGVERLALQYPRKGPSIKGIAQQRMPQVGQVNPDLVRAACFQRQLQESRPAGQLER